MRGGRKHSLAWLDFSSTVCSLNVPFKFQTMAMSKFLMAVGDGGEGTLPVHELMHPWIDGLML